MWQQEQQRARRRVVPSPMCALLILTVALAAAAAASIPEHDDDHHHHHKRGGSGRDELPQLHPSSAPPPLAGRSRASGPDSGPGMAQSRSLHGPRRSRQPNHHHQQQQQLRMDHEEDQVAPRDLGFAPSSKHHGGFNTDGSACAEVEGRPCDRAAQCGGCYGLYTCSPLLGGTCTLKSVSRNIGAFRASLRGSSHILHNHRRHRTNNSNREKQ
ncbi:uncharacterized protein LOC116949338 isoform X2 [Petromyzon marinus]|nr:uncharacterized protein LOC116949338 isoform X2 [Petromyzon marinus]